MSHEWNITDCFNVDYYPDYNQSFGFYKNMSGELSGFRITGFYKTYVHPLFVGPETPHQVMIRELVNEVALGCDDEKSEIEKLESKFKIKIIPCAKEEAEFVAGSGVAGCIVPIEWLINKRPVSWKEEDIARGIREYGEYLKGRGSNPLFDSHTNPRFNDAVRQLNQCGLEGGEWQDSTEYRYHDAWVKKFDGRAYYEI